MATHESIDGLFDRSTWEPLRDGPGTPRAQSDIALAACAYNVTRRYTCLRSGEVTAEPLPSGSPLEMPGGWELSDSLLVVHRLIRFHALAEYYGGLPSQPEERFAQVLESQREPSRLEVDAAYLVRARGTRVNRVVSELLYCIPSPVYEGQFVGLSGPHISSPYEDPEQTYTEQVPAWEVGAVYALPARGYADRRLLVAGAYIVRAADKPA